MAQNPQGMLAVAQTISMTALRKVTTWASAIFAATALLVALVAWLAGGASALWTPPTLVVALALGAALGYVAGFLALLFEAAHIIEARLSEAHVRR